MDFRYGEHEERFRREVKQFLDENLPPEWPDGVKDPARVQEIRKNFTQKLKEKGWVTLAWPKEFGGQGRTVMEQVVFKEEMGKRAAPFQADQGVMWVGPLILQYGTEEQKQYHIPKIVNLEEKWCSLYSEPNAGSDLANVQTRAVEDGDFWVINGQKIWTSLAHLADWGLCVSRTNPEAIKHRGISLIMVPMNTPGIKIQRIINMAGGDGGFNQVFLDNVRVPKSNLLGVKDRGWQQLRLGLQFERSGGGGADIPTRTAMELVEMTKSIPHNGGTLNRDRLVRQKLADLLVRARVGRNLSLRIPWMQSKNQPMTYEPSATKVYGSELNQLIAQVGISLAGLWGQVEADSRVPRGGALSTSYKGSISSTIAAGTSEIQRNIIAQALGLPRSYDP